MNLQERRAAVTELQCIASEARYLSKLRPSLTTKVEHDRCVAEFEDLYQLFMKLRSRIARARAQDHPWLT